MATKKSEYKFTKEQLTNSAKYAEEKDILQAVLDDNELYSVDEADAAIEDFRKDVKA